MTGLAALQRAFERHVRCPGAAMERQVLATPAAGAARRLGVYADAYLLRLTAALEMDYPALQGLLGERAFRQAMRDYVAAVPSHHPNLRWYGARLADYLRQSARWGRRPILAELARFEWALGLAFDAADAPVAGAEAAAGLGAEQWPGMRIRLQPSLRVLRLRGDVPRVWRAAIAGRRPPAAALRPLSAHWLVWRRDHEPCYRTLSAAEAWALGAAARGREFAALCDGLRRHAGAAGAAQAAAQFLRDWLDAGLVSGVEAGTVRSDT